MRLTGKMTSQTRGEAMGKRLVSGRLQEFLSSGVDLESKTIYVGSGDPTSDMDIDSSLTERVVKSISLLDASRREVPITFLINGRGGDTTHGRAIMDAIQGCDSPTIGKVIGSAESMCAWILQACEVRYMFPAAKLMFHQGEVSLSGHIEYVIREADYLRQEMRDFENILLRRIRVAKPCHTRASLRNKIRFDWKLSAEEAIEWGLADAICLDI